MSECCGRWRPVAAGDALSLDQRLKLLRDLYVQLCNTFVERALATILGAGRQINVFLRAAESCDQLGLGIDHHQDTPAVAGGSLPRLRSPPAMPPDSRPSSQVWQHEGDGPRGLILDIPTLLHGKERRCAFDAPRPAQASVGPLHGNVFGPTFQVWASVVVRGRIAHRRSLAETRYLRVFHWRNTPFHGMFLGPVGTGLSQPLVAYRKNRYRPVRHKKPFRAASAGSLFHSTPWD